MSTATRATRPDDATTPFAELIGANAHLHLRRTEVYELIAALTNEPVRGSTRRELAETLAAVLYTDADLIKRVGELAEAAGDR